MTFALQIALTLRTISAKFGEIWWDLETAVGAGGVTLTLLKMKIVS
jgi:hypothetical protein